jgi:hypothetical protein
VVVYPFVSRDHEARLVELPFHAFLHVAMLRCAFIIAPAISSSKRERDFIATRSVKVIYKLH